VTELYQRNKISRKAFSIFFAQNDDSKITFGSFDSLNTTEAIFLETYEAYDPLWTVGIDNLCYGKNG
jgi:hypothetical protein